MICQHDRPTVGLARNDRADGVLAQRDARATARQCGARPLRIARGISAFAIIAIFLALHRTDGASACWKKQVKIDDGPERLVPSQGGTNGSNPPPSSERDARSTAEVREHLSHKLMQFCVIDHLSLLPVRLSQPHLGPASPSTPKADLPTTSWTVIAFAG